jgi:hypothetical protein
LTNPTDSPEAWAAHCGRISDNRITFEVWRTFQAGELEASTVEVRPEGVYVFLSDLDDLAEWYEATDGVVERGAPSGALRSWLLTIDTGPECRGLMVWVSAQGMADAQVMGSLEAAADATDRARQALVPSQVLLRHEVTA